MAISLVLLLPLAIPLLTPAKASPPPGPAPWQSLTNQAFRSRAEGRLNEAEARYREALAGLTRAVGRNHPDCATILNNLGRIRASMGDLKAAQRLHEEAVAAFEQSAQGADHPYFSKALAHLAEVLEARKRFGRAVAVRERALALDESREGATGALIATHLERLAWMEYKRSRLARAIAFQERAVSLRAQQAGSNSVGAAERVTSLAALYFRVGRFDEAAARFASAVPILEAHWGATDPRLLPTLVLWEQALKRLEDFSGAARLEARSMGIRVRAALRQ